jgi:branched-chain amino acid transport system substrate-binding protein
MLQTLIRKLPAALLTAASVAVPALAQTQGEPIRMGAIVSATGPAGFVGDPQRKTLELLVRRVNDSGGLLGRKIALTVYDDQSDPNNANTFAKRLVESDKVDLLLGGTISPAAMAIAPHAERAGVPYVSTGAAQALVDPVRKWVFRVTPSDRLQAQRMLQDAKDRGFTRIAMLSENSGFGQSGRKEILAVAESLGMQVLGDETFGARDADVVPQLTKIRGLKDVQALIFFCGPGPAGALTMKNYTQLSMSQPVYMPSAVLSPEFIKAGGAATEVVRIPAQAFVVPDALPDSDPQKKPALDYHSAYREEYKVPAMPFGGPTADAFNLAVHAIKRAGSADKAKVRDAIEGTSGYVGLLGVYNMTPADHNGLRLDSLRILEVRGGRFTLAK